MYSLRNSVAKEQDAEMKKSDGWKLLPGALFAITLFVFAPLEMYLSNSNEFWFNYSTLLPYTALLGFGCFIIISVLLMKPINQAKEFSVSEIPISYHILPKIYFKRLCNIDRSYSACSHKPASACRRFCNRFFQKHRQQETAQ